MEPKETGQTHVQKVITSIEAVIEGRATKDQESYAINGRQLRRTPLSELLKLRNTYTQERNRLEQIKKTGNSLFGRPIYTRFS